MEAALPNLACQSPQHTPYADGAPQARGGGGGRERGPVSWHQFRCGQVCEAWPPHPGKVPRPPGLGTFPRLLIALGSSSLTGSPREDVATAPLRLAGLARGLEPLSLPRWSSPGLLTPGRSPSRPSCPILHFSIPVDLVRFQEGAQRQDDRMDLDGKGRRGSICQARGPSRGDRSHRGRGRSWRLPSLPRSRWRASQPSQRGRKPPRGATAEKHKTPARGCTPGGPGVSWDGAQSGTPLY